MGRSAVQRDLQQVAKKGVRRKVCPAALECPLVPKADQCTRPLSLGGATQFANSVISPALAGNINANAVFPMAFGDRDVAG
jgi:hypothetical protein